MTNFINKLIGLYLIAIVVLVAFVAALVVTARFAGFVPLLLASVVILAAAWRWARGDWG